MANAQSIARLVRLRRYRRMQAMRKAAAQTPSAVWWLLIILGLFAIVELVSWARIQ